MSRTCDVAVVGAGLAGLSAATVLKEAGCSVIVVEARDRVGGRTHGRTIDRDIVLELGGQWIGPTQTRMYALATELGIPVFPTHDQGHELALIGGRRHRYRRIPHLSPVALADAALAMAQLERMARRVPREAPWAADKAYEWDSETFASWLRRTTRTSDAREGLALYATTLLADDASSFSLLQLLVYIRSGTSFRTLIGIRGGAQQDRLEGGAHRVAEVLAARLGDAVTLNAPVSRIKHTTTVADPQVQVIPRAASRALPES